MRFLLNPAVYAAVCDEALREAGVDTLFHAMPADAVWPGSEWTLTVCTKTGLRSLETRVLVDCTGDANVVGLAGYDLCRSAVLQPATLIFTVTGYDAESLDYPAIQRAFEAAATRGDVRLTDSGWARGAVSHFLKSYGGNKLHLPEADARTSEGKSAADIAGRQAMMRLLRFFRRQPGLEHCRIAECAVECGIRETVTIRGRQTVTASDYESGRCFEDAVCYAHYPIDIHRFDYVETRALARGVRPTVPLGALLPEGSRFLLAAGRCVSSDQAANSALRVKAPCMAMGQAAGAAAALSARAALDPADLPLDRLRALLRAHGAIVPGDDTSDRPLPHPAPADTPRGPNSAPSRNSP